MQHIKKNFIRKGKRTISSSILSPRLSSLTSQSVQLPFWWLSITSSTDSPTFTVACDGPLNASSTIAPNNLKKTSWQQNKQQNQQNALYFTHLFANGRKSSLGYRELLVTATRAWNSLLSTVTAASALHSFRRALKTHLFAASFPPN